MQYVKNTVQVKQRFPGSKGNIFGDYAFGIEMEVPAGPFFYLF